MVDPKTTLSYKLSLVAFILATCVVLLGSYTRLVDAGLGCPDWPGCYGFLSVPHTLEEMQHAEARFPDSPVEHSKAWVEMSHRYLAAALGFLILFLAIRAIINREDENKPLLLPVILLLLVIFQGALGMWTVTMGLLPVIVLGHLLGGFLTLSLLWLLFLNIRDNNLFSIASPLRALLIPGVVIIFIQITLGGWTSANYAAIICSDFPTCQGNWIPPLNFNNAFQIFSEDITNYSGGHLDNTARVTIHWLHRVGALLTTLYVICVSFFLYKSGWKKYAIWLALVLILQVGLGISNVVFSLPLAVAVAHNGIAALLLLSFLTIIHSLGLPKHQL